MKHGVCGIRRILCGGTLTARSGSSPQLYIRILECVLSVRISVAGGLSSDAILRVSECLCYFTSVSYCRLNIALLSSLVFYTAFEMTISFSYSRLSAGTGLSGVFEAIWLEKSLII